MPDIQSDAATLPLDGSLTVRTIGAVHAALVEALARNDAVQVDCTGAASVDLSLIQLLLAARRSADEAGKHLTLAAPAGGVLLAALERGGFLRSAEPDPFWSGAR